MRVPSPYVPSSLFLGRLVFSALDVWARPGAIADPNDVKLQSAALDTSSLCRFDVFPSPLSFADPLSTAEFVAYLRYTRSLRFDETPDYAFLRQMFRDVYVRKRYTDVTFDWCDPTINPALAAREAS